MLLRLTPAVQGVRSQGAQSFPNLDILTQQAIDSDESLAALLRQFLVEQNVAESVAPASPAVPSNLTVVGSDGFPLDNALLFGDEERELNFGELVNTAGALSKLTSGLAVLDNNQSLATVAGGLGTLGTIGNIANAARSGSLQNVATAATPTVLGKLGAAPPVAGAIMGGLTAGAPGALGGLAQGALAMVSPPVAAVDAILNALGAPSISGKISNAVNDTNFGLSLAPDSGLIAAHALGSGINNSPDPLGSLINHLSISQGWTDSAVTDGMLAVANDAADPIGSLISQLSDAQGWGFNDAPVGVDVPVIIDVPAIVDAPAVVDSGSVDLSFGGGWNDYSGDWGGWDSGGDWGGWGGSDDSGYSGSSDFGF